MWCNPSLWPQDWHGLLECFWPVTWAETTSALGSRLNCIEMCLVLGSGILRSLTAQHDLDVLIVFLPRSFCHLQWLSFAPARDLFQFCDIVESKSWRNIGTYRDYSAAGPDARGYNDSSGNAKQIENLKRGGHCTVFFVTRLVDMSSLPRMAQQFSKRWGLLSIARRWKSHASNHVESLLGMVHDWVWWFSVIFNILLYLHVHLRFWSAKTSRSPKSVNR